MTVPATNLRQVGASSFGGGSAPFSARGVFDSQRTRELDRRQAYFDCTQHDSKQFDFDGRIIASGGGGMAGTQPMITEAKAAFFVPLRMRRPSSPYRLGRVIVSSFTNLVFGDARFPKFRVDGDDATQDFVGALATATNLPVKMIRARNLGGAVGSVGLSWAFMDGRPRVEVHNAKNLYVHSWDDREQCVPGHVSELFQYPQDDWDPLKRRFVRNTYWYRRDWDHDADIIFEPILVQPGKDPAPEDWRPDLSRSAEHHDGMAHFVWIQNTPTDEVDGLPDYDGLYESFDTIDLMLSVLARGATLNLDPTLKLKMDPDLVARMGVRKGSDNALIVGEEGDAEYLELAGTSIEAGLKLFDAKRRVALEVAQCVLPDPDEIAAGAVSSVALKVVYAPMLGKADIYREQYGAGLVRLLTAMTRVARKSAGSTVTVYDSDGNSQEVERVLSLPPRVTRDPEVDNDGNPTGEDVVSSAERDPGAGEDVEPDWGPYFPPTPADQQAAVTTLSTATGQQQFMSVETAAEIAAAAFGRTPREEWGKIQKARAVEEQKQADMFAQDPGAGAGVKRTMTLPSGASVQHQIKPAADAGAGDGATGGGATGNISLSPTDIRAITTVDEARASMGLPPIGGEDGGLPVAAFLVKYQPSIAAAAQGDLGTMGVPPPSTPPKPDPPPPGASPFGAKPGAPPGVTGSPPHLGAPPGAPPPPGQKPPFPVK